jgi:hypothetical protein
MIASRVLLFLGIVLFAMGLLWTLQGVGVVGGSFMSGNTTWAVIGPIVAVAGLAIGVVAGVRIRRGPQR